MVLSNCGICVKKLAFIKNQELNNFNNISDDQFKMNKIIDKCLLTGDKFMPALHSKQPRSTYSARGPFTKHCQRIQNFKNM